MSNHEIMSREEIMEAIREGDKYAGILVEEIDDKVDMVLADNDRLDNKIDVVDLKLEDFRRETNANFNLIFEEHQEILRKFVEMDEKFSKRFDNLEKII